VPYGQGLPLAAAQISRNRKGFVVCALLIDDPAMIVSYELCAGLAPADRTPLREVIRQIKDLRNIPVSPPDLTVILPQGISYKR
jgi:ABC-type branched-subunit amino acid transport system ATPase component